MIKQTNTIMGNQSSAKKDPKFCKHVYERIEGKDENGKKLIKWVCKFCAKELAEESVNKMV